MLHDSYLKEKIIPLQHKAQFGILNILVTSSLVLHFVQLIWYT